MPDYNPAVAAGIQTPQTNLLPTLEGISQLQIGQAHAGLYSLQALQQQRQFNALQAAANAYRSNQDPVSAYLGEGGDPAGANSLQGLYTNQRAMALTPNHLMPAQENEIAQYPGNVAKSKSALEQYNTDVRGGAASVANGYVADPSPYNRQKMIDYTLQHQGKDAAEEVASLSSDELMARAKGFRGAGLTAEQGAKMVQTENQEGAPVYQGTAEFIRSPGVVGASPQQKEQQKYFGDLNKGIQAQGNVSASNLDDIHLAKAALNDPNFYSGAGQTYNLMAKRFAAMGLGDPAAALPQEVLSKVMAANIIQQTNGMKAAAESMGANSSRLFAAQIDLMEKASQNPENTVAANRFLTEIAERAANKNISLANSASNYKKGILDSQFEPQFRAAASKPIFTNWELSHLDTIGAPMADKLAKIDPREIEHLKSKQGDPAKFDAYYGPGTARAAGAQ